MAARVSEKLLQRLRNELDLDIPEGAWVWTVTDADGTPMARDSEGRPMAIGSQWTMTELLRLPLVAHPDLFGDIVIEPTDEAQQAMRRG